MSTRNRLNPKEVAQLTSGLYDILTNTTNYLEIPLTDAEMVAVWEESIATEIKEALVTLHRAGYATTIHSRCVLCNVPELKMLVRFLNKENASVFLLPPEKGPFKVGRVRTPEGAARAVKLLDFDHVLAKESYAEFLTWASAAASANTRQVEARETINAIIQMLSTAGQLRRMVPELVQYLPRCYQESVAAQMRSSPFPEEWAAYPKDKVDRMLAALAEGHLFHGMGKRDVSRSGNWFSWAMHYTEKA